MLLILVAGNETTRNLIGNGMLALLRNPGQLQRLRDHPDLLDAAVDEMLRYDSPVQINGRYVREDVEIGGKRIRAGQRVLTMIGAANRDPEIFEDPETMDICRRQKNHLSFGLGIHYCLGPALAVLEGAYGLCRPARPLQCHSAGGRAPAPGRNRPARRRTPVDRSGAISRRVTAGCARAGTTMPGLYRDS